MFVRETEREIPSYERTHAANQGDEVKIVNDTIRCVTNQFIRHLSRDSFHYRRRPRGLAHPSQSLMSSLIRSVASLSVE